MLTTAQLNKYQMSETPTSGTNSSTLRIGLIGSGKMGLQHLKVIAGIPTATVVGIADPAADTQMLESLLPLVPRCWPTPIGCSP